MVTVAVSKRQQQVKGYLAYYVTINSKSRSVTFPLFNFVIIDYVVNISNILIEKKCVDTAESGTLCPCASSSYSKFTDTECLTVHAVYGTVHQTRSSEECPSRNRLFVRQITNNLRVLKGVNHIDSGRSRIEYREKYMCPV